MVNPSPLTRLYVDLSDWSEQLAYELANEYGTSDASSLYERFRARASDLMVWLAVKGRHAESDEIDDALSQLREVLWRYDNRELPALMGDREGDDPCSPFERLQMEIRTAIGRLEDLDCAIAGDVWAGFDDA